MVTTVDGVHVAFYSLHISGWKGSQKNDTKNNTHAYQLTTGVLPKETTDRVIVVGDFNNNIGDTLMNEIEASGFGPTWKDLNIDVSKESTYYTQESRRKRKKPYVNPGVIDHILYNTASGAKATDGAIIELEKP